jgi:hypothetical protein
VITAAAGDDGYLNWLEEPESPYPDFPADLPQVVAVGGTRLSPLGTHGGWTGESVWNDGGETAGFKGGYGAGGGGCSTQFNAKPWQTAVSDWSRVGCGGKRAVADVSADADPYSGVAVYDSSSEECQTPYFEENKVTKQKIEHVLHDWCTIGGTSLASPLVASTYALAGGAQGVKYPARTLYENAVKSPGSLHDITNGSNGKCSMPFAEETGESPCTSSEEAQASCSSRLICLAATGYDGPTGVGTPDGITAFDPPEEVSEEQPVTPNPFPPPVISSYTSGTPTSSPAPTDTEAPAVQLTDLALTPRALIALNRSRPKISQLRFEFTLTVAVHVRASLEERVGKRGHRHWKPVQRPLTIAAVSGHNSRQLAGSKRLGAGAYRLTLAPSGGTPRSITFDIG